MALEVQILRDSDSFLALKGEWNDLYARAHDPHYFQSFNWIWAAWQENALPKGRQLFIVVCRENDRAVLIWPLMIQGRRLARFLSSDRGEYRDILVERSPKVDEWFAVAFETFREQSGVDLVQLQDVHQGSYLNRYFTEQCPGARRHIRSAPLIALDRWPDFDSYMASLPGKLRRDQRRQWRRITEEAKAEYEVVVAWENVLETLHWLYDTKLAWMSQRDLVSPSFDCDEYRNFLHHVCEDAFNNGSLVVSRIVSGAEIISASLSFVSPSEFTFYMFAYDERWESFSPGRLLMERNLDWAKTRGVGNFDFMHGTLTFKERWTDLSAEVTDYLVPCSATGSLLVAWYSSALRRRLLNMIWGSSSARAIGNVPEPLRSIGEFILLSRWGDPFEET